MENLSEVQTQVQSQLPPIADLRDQVQLTYWSNHHFVAQVLLDQLPFGEILGSYRFYQYVDYQLPSLLEAARRNLLYWTLTDICQYNGTPTDQISLFYNETFLCVTLLGTWPAFFFLFLLVMYLYDHLTTSHMTDYLYTRAILSGTLLFPLLVHSLLFSLYGSL